MINKKDQLSSLYSQFINFKDSCLYISGAQSIVFGEGDVNTPIIFIGEAPGSEEDIHARPFVGRAGKLLTSTIESYSVKRSSVFITNIVKCRPPHNRIPTEKELKAGKELILIPEINIIKPNLIVTLGASAFKGLSEIKNSITHARGKIIKTIYGDVMPLYHPAYILRNPLLFDIFNKDIETALKHVKLI